jgi:glycosyltransferase involved in cell wall biosynthesis
MALIKLPKMKLNWQKINPIKLLKKFRIRPERIKYDKSGPLKVAFFTDTYLPNVDGVVNAMISYKHELEKRGDSVYIFTSGTDADEKEFGNKQTFYFESLIFPPYPQYKVAVFPFNSIRYARKARVHLIHSHAIASMGVAAIASAKTLNLPLVGTFHTMLPKTSFVLTKNSFGRKIFSQFAWSAIERFYSPFDLVTAPSKTIVKLLNKNGIQNTAVAPNGVDIKKFAPVYDPKIVRALLGIKPHEKILLTAGRLSDEKNVDVLLKAFVKVIKEKDAKFIIQGDGPAKAKLQKLTKKLHLEKDVIFTGFVKSYEVPFFYCAADAFATASTFETQGLALLESMACQKVCIGANSLAIPELLDNGRNGYLFKPFDEADCTEKILTALILKDGKKNRIEENARKTALQFSIEKSTDKLLAAYEKVL